MGIPTGVTDRRTDIVGPAPVRSLASDYGIDDRRHERKRAGGRPTAFASATDQRGIDPEGRP